MLESWEVTWSVHHGIPPSRNTLAYLTHKITYMRCIEACLAAHWLTEIIPAFHWSVQYARWSAVIETKQPHEATCTYRERNRAGASGASALCSCDYLECEAMFKQRQHRVPTPFGAVASPSLVRYTRLRILKRCRGGLLGSGEVVS